MCAFRSRTLTVVVLTAVDCSFSPLVQDEKPPNSATQNKTEPDTQLCKQQDRRVCGRLKRGLGFVQIHTRD